MAGVRRFQDLECHQLAVAVRRQVLRLVSEGPARKDFRFSNQIRDSARGAPRNIAEGYSRFNPAEILPFLSYAKSSLDETKNHLRDGAEERYFGETDTAIALDLIDRAIAAISRWRQYLESPAARRFYEQHKARRASAAFVPRARTPSKER